MKKLLSILIAVMFSLGLNAQTELTEAPDFTATDYSGNEIHLYEILEGGQYVLLHITLPKDDTLKVPPLVEAYKKLGCNQHDVFFVGALTNGTQKNTSAYIEKYGIEFPMIHNTDESYGVDGPAIDIMNKYGFPTTTVLIAPDKTVALEIETIETSDDVITALKAFGIKEYECGGEDPETPVDPEEPGDGGEEEGEDPEEPVDPEEPGDGGEEGEDPETPVDPEQPGEDDGEEPGDEQPEEITPVVEMIVKEVTTTSVKVTFTPAGECASYFILLGTEAEMNQWVTVMGVSLEQLIESWGGEKSGTTTSTWDKQIPNTEYTVYALSKDIEGETIQLDTIKVTTEILGGEGVSVIDLQVEVTSNTSAFVTATPNEETAEYHYILIEKSYADSIGVDSTMKIIYEDPYTLYEIDRWEWIDLRPETEYFAIAQGKNVKGEWGEITKVEFVTTTEGNIELVEDNFNIYPNPVNDKIYIETEVEVEEVVVYTITGVVAGHQSMVNGQQSTVIDVTNLNSGIYFVKVVTENGEVVKRFVKK